MGENVILQEKNYIAQQKKKYLIYSIIWTAVVLVTFGVGLLITKTRANLFTVSACLTAIVAALYITRLISFSRYNDGDFERANMLESISGNYHIYHSAIVPLEKGTAPFEHIMVTESKIYFIAYTKQQITQYREDIKVLLGQFGIASQHLCFLVAQDVSQMKQHTNRIKKEMETISKHQGEGTDYLEAYSKKISEILM
ncbi:MAG: hypothetical protein J6F30_07470 [Cellulosilyticum sp.]|nr:hypothetical protein [Cellulosilyticum sp.]